MSPVEIMAVVADLVETLTIVAGATIRTAGVAFGAVVTFAAVEPIGATETISESFRANSFSKAPVRKARLVHTRMYSNDTCSSKYIKFTFNKDVT